MKLIVLLLALPALCTAFAPLPGVPRAIARTVHSGRAVRLRASEADKDDLLATVVDGPATSVSNSKRIVVNELLLKHEAANPTEAPAASDSLNGVWELVYSGGYSQGLLQSPTRQIALFLYAGGYAPGQFLLQAAGALPESILSVSDLSVSISRNQPRAESKSTVQVASTTFDLSVASTLETESDVRLKETYTAVNVNGNNMEVPSSLQYSRLLYVTYLDEDILVVRDESGVPEILVRKEKEFLMESTGEPSSADDDLAPGAG